MPAAHTPQAEKPSADEKVPAAQFWHTADDTAPNAVEYVPMGQRGASHASPAFIMSRVP